MKSIVKTNNTLPHPWTIYTAYDGPQAYPVLTYNPKLASKESMEKALKAMFRIAFNSHLEGY